MENKDLIHRNCYFFLDIALLEAKKAEEKGEVPIGAVIVSSEGKVIAKAHNLVQTDKNPLHHAEILAISKACKKLNEKYLVGCSMFITLEPCPMCATAISLAKIQDVYFSTMDIKGGAIISGLQVYKNGTNLYKPSVFYEPEYKESSLLLKRFFRELRNNQKMLGKSKKMDYNQS